MSVTINNLATGTLANNLADRIRIRIQSEQLGDGDFFMTESQLASEYKVSRTVAREAVSRLSALGLLEGRKRKGLIVRRPNPLRLLSNSLPSLTQSKEDLHELAKLRYVLEVGAIEMAVTNATEKQIEQLDELARQFECAVHDQVGNETEDQLELEFHGLILQMTGSTLVAGMQRVLAQFFEAIEQEATQTVGSKDRVVWQHHELVAAIRSRDIEQARSVLRSHFRNILCVGGR